MRPLRHRRHYYPQYSHYPDDHYWGWLSSTAISLAILDNLNEHQHREHELALFNATRAPLGETITWSDGSVTGAVTATKEGTSSMGRYCREFQHQVTIGGKSELLYGTACRNPDGSWQIVQ